MTSSPKQSAPSVEPIAAFSDSALRSLRSYLTWGYGALLVSFFAYAVFVAFIKNSSLPWFLTGARIVAESAVPLLLLKRKLYYSYPVFFLFTCWNLLADLASTVLASHAPANWFLYREVISVLGSLLTLCVLGELTWSVFRPIRGLLRYISVAAMVLPAFLFMILWPVMSLWIPGGSLAVHLSRFDQDLRLTGIIVFLAVMCFSQMLALRWRNREFQIASGLLLLFAGSLASMAVFWFVVAPAAATFWNTALLIVYLLVQVFWVFCFAIRETTSERVHTWAILLSLFAETAIVRARLHMHDQGAPNRVD